MRWLAGTVCLVVLAGCSGPPAKVEGIYVGYIGGEYSNKKMGLNVNLKRTDSVLLGKGDITYDVMSLMLSREEVKELQVAMRDTSNRPRTTFTTAIDLVGNLRGDSFQLDLKPEAPAKFEIKMKGTYADATNGGPKLSGEAQVWRDGKFVDTRPLTLKPLPVAP